MSMISAIVSTRSVIVFTPAIQASRDSISSMRYAAGKNPIFCWRLNREWRRSLRPRASFQPVDTAVRHCWRSATRSRLLSRLKGHLRGQGHDSANSVISSAVLGLLILWRIASGLCSPAVADKRKARVGRGDFAPSRRGRNGCAGNSKGCDIGYALVTSSCEEANSVDACTVAALDAITAFAVPNPNCSSQSQSVFSGLVVLRVTPANRSLSLLRTG